MKKAKEGIFGTKPTMKGLDVYIKDEAFIYTIGYSKLKGTHPERAATFRKRLWDLKCSLGNLWIVDIREKDCGSYNGYRFAQGENMKSLVHDAGHLYIPEPNLSNKFGNTVKGLKNYDHWLAREIPEPGDAGDAFGRIHGWIDDSATQPYKVVLMCACGKAMKTRWHNVQGEVPTGNPNCHRVPLGIALSDHFPNCNLIHL